MYTSNGGIEGGFRSEFPYRVKLFTSQHSTGVKTNTAKQYYQNDLKKTYLECFYKTKSTILWFILLFIAC